MILGIFTSQFSGLLKSVCEIQGANLSLEFIQTASEAGKRSIQKMASGSQLANQARKSRTSIVFLILSAASIYYSTQVCLNYPPNWWTKVIAGAGVVFFIVAMILMYQDHQHESDYRDLLRRDKRADVLSKEAEIKEIQEDQTEVEQEDEIPADIASEGEPLPGIREGPEQP